MWLVKYDNTDLKNYLESLKKEAKKSMSHSQEVKLRRRVYSYIELLLDFDFITEEGKQMLKEFLEEYS